VNKTFVLKWGIADVDWNYASAIWMGPNADMWDSGEAQPGGGGQDRGRGVSAALVDAGAPEAGHHSERGGSRFTVVAKRLATVYPTEYPKRFTVQMESLTNSVVGRFKATLYIVLAAVGLLLLIAAETWRTCCWRGRPRGKKSLRSGRRWGRAAGG